jgi:hypothetical protein
VNPTLDLHNCFAWQKIDDEFNVWGANYRVPNFRSRSTALELTSSRTLVISPGSALIGADLPLLKNNSLPPYLLAPNSYHHEGITPWRERYPGSTVFASGTAIPRLLRLGLTNIRPLASLRDELPNNISIFEPPGTRSGEVWLQLRGNATRTWIVCDSFFNYKALSAHPIARAMQILFQAAPGLRISSIVKWWLIKDRKQYRKWVLDLLASEGPNRLIPAHGAIASDSDLANALASLVKRRF